MVYFFFYAEPTTGLTRFLINRLKASPVTLISFVLIISGAEPTKNLVGLGAAAKKKRKENSRDEDPGLA